MTADKSAVVVVPKPKSRARARDRYLKPFAERRRKIVAMALKLGQSQASAEFGISRQRVSELVLAHEQVKAAKAKASAKSAAVVADSK